MLDNRLLEKIMCLTDEEIHLFNGKQTIDKSIFIDDESDIIDYHKILKDDQEFSVRKHVRFCEYPKHKHNYMELMYVYSGKMTQMIDDNIITIHEGELLLLNQNIEHAIQYTDENDIIFNFIIKPDYLHFLSKMIEQDNKVYHFLFNDLYSYHNDGEYLLFKAKDNQLIQSYIESIIAYSYQPSLNQSLKIKFLVGLLLTELMNHPENIETYSKNSYDKIINHTLLKYIMSHYQSCSLQELSQQTNLPDYQICKIMKKVTGKTFKHFIQDLRLEKATILLNSTDLSVEHIGKEVGYENISYFHRIFKKKYGVTPNIYRQNNER